MGYDNRDYAYGSQPGIHLEPPKTIVNRLVLFTVGVYVLQLMIPSFTSFFEAEPRWFQKPWEIYRLLTYGFLHATQGISQDVWVISHLAGNMFMLWMFGRDLEYKYGRREFLYFYLWAIFFAGLFWSISEASVGRQQAAMVGASGGISALMVLFAFTYPHRKVLMFFVIPMPMWVLALFLVLNDLMGSLTRTSNIAFTAHLAGAVAGLYYYKFGFSPFAWIANRFSGVRPKRSPKLRLHSPAVDDNVTEDDRENEILKKIHEQGQDSLTRSERRYLEKNSEKYRRKRS